MAVRRRAGHAVPDASLDTIIALNDNVKRWGIEDFFNSYSRQGKTDYTTAINFARTYGVSLYTVVKATGQGKGSYRSGSFSFDNEKEARLAELMEVVKEIASFWGKRNAYKTAFIVGLSKVFSVLFINLDYRPWFI